MADNSHDHGEPWDESDTRWLINLRKSGRTYSQIAHQLGRSILSVGSKLYRLRKNGVDV